MDEHAVELIADDIIEILPPEPRETSGRHMRICLCCGRSCVSMSEDGCGICDECLAP